MDFFCKDLVFVVEIDGESHDYKGDYDKQREHYLEGLGIKVYHFKDEAIKKDLDAVMKQLSREILNTPSFQDTPL